MMDELVNEVAQKTGLSQDQAQAAVTSVIGFLRNRLPAPLAGALDHLLSGGSTDGLAAEASEIFGSLLGKRS
jgi:hypothetical protein